MSVFTEFSFAQARFPRRLRPAVRVALATPVADLTYEQARLLRRYWDRVAGCRRRSAHAWSMSRWADSLVERMEAERKLSVLAYGDTMPDIKIYALRRAAGFFGTDAGLEIVSVDTPRSACRMDRGAFCADVLVRMAGDQS